ncbi:MAG: hypothetical protein Q4A88_02320 [Clostridia bacterium]|nr:hypothetical protein [Clostridia bacterium]
MNLREMKRIAETEILRYRESAAFVKGYLDGGGSGDSKRFAERQRWVWAVERVRTFLRSAAPEREVFFARLYQLDVPHAKRCVVQESILRLSMELYASPQTLYRWREEILLSVAIAAVQAKALRPY